MQNQHISKLALIKTEENKPWISASFERLHERGRLVDLQSFPLPLFGALLDLLRIFMRFLDMKYGFWRDPSLRSRSSTARVEDRNTNTNLVYQANMGQKLHWIFAFWSVKTCVRPNPGVRTLGKYWKQNISPTKVKTRWIYGSTVMFQCELSNICKYALTEAEEECVHTHVVHAEEPVSYEVAAKHHRLQNRRHENEGNR